MDYPNRFAVDFARAEDAKFSTDSPGRRNEDYASWGAPILAPGDGIVAGLAEDVADNRPGRSDRGVSAIGNGPHLHYNLQTGPLPNTGTGLPAQFLRYAVDATAVDRGEPTRGQHIRNQSEPAR